MTAIRVRSGRGLGDSLYLRPIVDYFVRSGQRRVTALSNYPAIFTGSGATVEPFTRNGPATVAHYTHAMANQTSTQFADMLRLARITEPVALRFNWTVQNRKLVDSLLQRAGGRPLILVHGGREPMQRGDGFAREMVPRWEAFDAALSALPDCFLVRIGNAPHLYSLPVHLDLNGKTSVADLLDLASVCAGVVAQCSFAVPLAEVFGKPLLAIWAMQGLKSRTAYVRTITPAKVLTAPTSKYLMDDWSDAFIKEATTALLLGRYYGCGTDDCRHHFRYQAEHCRAAQQSEVHACVS